MTENIVPLMRFEGYQFEEAMRLIFTSMELVPCLACDELTSNKGLFCPNGTELESPYKRFYIYTCCLKCKVDQESLKKIEDKILEATNIKT